MYKINNIFDSIEKQNETTIKIDTYNDIEKIKAILVNKFTEKYGTTKKFDWQFKVKKMNGSILLSIINYDACDIDYRNISKQNNDDYKLTPWVLDNLINDELKNVTLAPIKDIKKCGGTEKYIEYMRKSIDRVIDYPYDLELSEIKHQEGDITYIIRLIKQ